MIAAAVFFLAGAGNLLGYFFALPCGLLALWFLFPNKPKVRRDVGRRIEEHVEEFN
jgi:hypothetical protein